MLTLSLPARASDPWTLTSSDFQSRSVTLDSIDKSGLSVESGGATQLIPWDGVLELDRSLTAQTATGDFTLRLNGGDSIAGAPVAIAGDTLQWSNPVLGQLDIPEDRVNALVRSGHAIPGLDDPRPTDTVRLANGDSVTGVVQGLTSTTVNIQPPGADSATPITLDKVDAILLADPTPRAAPPGRAFRITTNDGSSLTFPILSLSAPHAQLSVGFSDATTRPLDLQVVATIEQVNGPVTWLTSLNPTIIYRPFLTENFPPRFDHPVAEPAVSIHDKYPHFHHGIGVHAYTRLTYPIPDGAASLRTQYAIDTIPSSDSTKADVTVRIYLDEKLIKEIPHVRAGPIADPLTIPLDSAKTLALEVDYGDNLAAQGRFVWLDPAFIRH